MPEDTFLHGPDHVSMDLIPVVEKRWLSFIIFSVVMIWHGITLTHLCKVNLSAVARPAKTHWHDYTVKYYQNIPNGLRVMTVAVIFSHFCLGEAIYNYLYEETWHLTISLVTSCQYVSACQNLSIYSKRYQSYSDFYKLITDGYASARLFIKKSGI